MGMIDTAPAAHDQEYCETIGQWIRANGVDPNNVPVGPMIEVDLDARTLTVQTFCHDGDGNVWIALTGDPHTEPRTVPMAVEPPEELHIVAVVEVADVEADGGPQS